MPLYGAIANGYGAKSNFNIIKSFKNDCDVDYIAHILKELISV